MGRVSLLAKPAVPGKPVAATESDQEVIAAQCAPNAYAKNGQEDVKNRETCIVDVAPLVTEAEDPVEDGSDRQANEGAETALPQQGDQSPLLENANPIVLRQEVKSDVQLSLIHI